MKNWFNNNKYQCATFLLTFGILLLAFSKEGVYPFGNKQIMIIDSWHQYFPFFSELHTKLREGGSLFHSWNVGMGTNFLYLMAYYAMSPLYLLSIFVSESYLREFFFIITIVKIAFSGMFFSIYLKGVFKRNDMSIMIFGLLYAFCGYMMGYYWNIMWLDAAALFPLIMLGLNRIINGEGYLLYIFSFALAVISNFYIGYFIAEFIVLYYLLLYFIKHDRFEWRNFFKQTVKIALYSLASLGLSALVLIPAFKGLQTTYGTASTNPSAIKFYFTIAEILERLFLGLEPSIRSGFPNIFSGLITMLLVIVFFSAKPIKMREKMAHGALISFLIISFNFNYLNFIWHGFHFPNEVPYRFAFVLSFLLITIAYKVFMNIEEITTRTILIPSAFLVAYLLLLERFGDTLNSFPQNIIYLNIAFVLLYALFIVMYQNKKIRFNIFVLFLGIMIITESYLTSSTAVTTAGSSGRDNYPPDKELVEQAVDTLYQNDPSFYRIEMLKFYSTNDSVLYGYRGVSAFTSTIHGSLSAISEDLGLSGSPVANRSLYTSNTPIVNALYNIKYFLDRNQNGRLPNAGYDLDFENENVSVYKNKYHIGTGFMVQSTIKEWDKRIRNPFLSQEQFVVKALNQNIKLFEAMPPSSEDYANTTRKEPTNGRAIYYSNKDPNNESEINFTYVLNSELQHYIYAFDSNGSDIEVKKNGSTVKYEARRGVIIDLGIGEAGTEIVASMKLDSTKDGYIYLELVEFDETAFEMAYNELKDETFEVASFTDRKLSGTIDVKEDGVLMTSIPYEKGWKATVDGKAVEIIPIRDAFISIELASGTHAIEFIYIPDGFVLGSIITLGTLAFILLWRFKKK